MPLGDVFFQKLHSFFENVTLRAYRHPWLAANFTLSRPLHSSFATAAYAQEGFIPPGPGEVLKRLVAYYRVNIRAMASFLLQRYRFRVAMPELPPGADLVVVDAQLLVEKAVDGASVDVEHFFPGLEEALRSAHVPYLVAATLHGVPSKENLITLSRMLGPGDRPYVLPYQLFTVADTVRLAVFCFFYPLRLLWFLRSLASGTPWERLLRRECIAALEQEVVSTYCRYLFGCGLSRWGRRLRILTWSENRASDKLFCLGVRQGREHVEIIGCRLYVHPANYFGLHYNQADVRYGLSPDRALSNGPGYLDKGSLIPEGVGQALRYAGMFTFEAQHSAERTLLILFPYHVTVMRDMAELLQGMVFSGFDSVEIRLHPSKEFDEWKQQLPPGSKPTKGTLHESFRHAAVVLGAESGALVEAIACGIPVVQINTLGELSSGYVPDLGRDKIWFEGSTPEEIKVCLERAGSVPPEVRQKYAREYKALFFSRPDPASMLASFGINAGGKKTRPAGR